MVKTAPCPFLALQTDRRYKEGGFFLEPLYPSSHNISTPYLRDPPRFMPTMSKPIVLILGAGGNIGANLTSTFTKEGYSIALASRSRNDGKTPQGHLNIKIDLTNPSSLSSAFEKTKKTFGVPNIVIYNAAMMRVPPDPEDMFSVSVEDMASDVNLMTVSAYAAAQEAVKGWEGLPETDSRGKKVFIYTGNMLNKSIMASPYVLTLGVGKAGAAYWIGSASALYAEKGYK